MTSKRGADDKYKEGEMTGIRGTEPVKQEDLAFQGTGQKLTT